MTFPFKPTKTIQNSSMSQNHRISKILGEKLLLKTPGKWRNGNTVTRYTNL